ncbi:MAG: ABC transporter substrate-binding protein [Halanaeroarchaeum sp.]
MSEHRSDDVSRRAVLSAVGSGAVATSLAGCTGGGGETTTTQTTTGTTDTTQTTDETDGQDGGEFPVTVTQGTVPANLDPHDNRSTATDIVMMQAYEALLRRDRVGNVQPELATSYERVEPGRYRFHIREGVTFHATGNQLTPEDVAYSINRVVKPSVGFQSPQASQLAGITGAEVVDGERAVDLLSDGLNPLMPRQIPNNGQIVEKAWVQDHEKSYVEQHMNGTGPFQLSSYQPNVRVVFERFEDYWKEPADVTKLTFNGAKQASTRVNQLIEGQTDIIVNVPPQSVSRVDSSEVAAINATPSTRIIYNAMRTDVEPFSSQKFRLAMNYAIDLQSIVDNVLGGFGDPTKEPTLEGFFGYDAGIDRFPHDPDRAEQLVEESGHAGASITLHTPVGRYLKDVQIAQTVVNMIDQLPNVTAELKQREFTALASELTDAKLDTSPPFYLIGWGNPQMDASQTIIPTLTSGGVLTSTHTEELDSLITQAQNTSGEERASLLKEANTLAHDEAFWIYLNRQYSVYGVSSRIDWQPRRDERIDAYAISPAE